MRAEAINVGVALCCPAAGFVRATVSDDNRRIRAAFRHGPCRQWLKALKRNIARRINLHAGELADREAFERFIGSLANEMTMTPARGIRVEVADAGATAGAEQTLDWLFARLVGDDDLPLRAGTADRIRQLERTFRELHRKGLARLDERVKVPLAGGLMRFPFAYQNGVLNLVKPHRFRADSAQVDNAALALAQTGRLLSDYSRDGGQRKLVVVSETPEPDGDEDARFAELFTKCGAEYVPFDQVEPFRERVVSEAHG